MPEGEKEKAITKPLEKESIRPLAKRSNFAVVGAGKEEGPASKKLKADPKAPHVRVKQTASLKPGSSSPTTFQESIQQACREHHKVIVECEKLTEKLEEGKARISCLESVIVQQDRQIYTLSKEKKALEGDDLRLKCKKLETDLAEEKNKNAENDTEIGKMMKEIEDKRKRYKELDKKHVLEVQKNKVTVEKMVGFKTELEKQRSELFMAQSKYNGLHHQYLSLQDGRVQDIQKHEALKKKHQELNDEYKKSSFEAAQEKCTLEKEIHSLQGDNRSLRTEFLYLKNKEKSYKVLLDGLLPKNDARAEGLGRRDDINYFRRVFSPTGVMVGHYGTPLEFNNDLWNKVKQLPDDPPENDTNEQKLERHETFANLIKAAESTGE